MKEHKTTKLTKIIDYTVTSRKNIAFLQEENFANGHKQIEYGFGYGFFYVESTHKVLFINNIKIKAFVKSTVYYEK